MLLASDVCVECVLNMLWVSKAYTKRGARGTPDPAEVVLGGKDTLAAPADVVHVRWARLMPYFWEGDPERAGMPVDSNGGVDHSWRGS